jgi:cytochrome bd-type quinol oxidase subunit 2
MKMIEKIKGFVKRLLKGRMKLREKRNLFEIVINTITIFILIIVYLLIGLVIAVPYTYLAGWDVNVMPSTVMFSPLALIVIVVFYFMARGERRYKSRGFKTTFWISIIYFLLPVIANGVSILLRWLELPYGDFVFEHRYQTFLVLPGIIIILLVCLIFASIWDSLFKKETNDQILQL